MGPRELVVNAKRAFHFAKMHDAAGAAHPSTLMSMNNRQGKYKHVGEMHRQASRNGHVLLDDSGQVNLYTRLASATTTLITV
jgi:hypothetical protein